MWSTPFQKKISFSQVLKPHKVLQNPSNIGMWWDFPISWCPQLIDWKLLILGNHFLIKVFSYIGNNTIETQYAPVNLKSWEDTKHIHLSKSISCRTQYAHVNDVMVVHNIHLSKSTHGRTQHAHVNIVMGGHNMHLSKSIPCSTQYAHVNIVMVEHNMHMSILPW